MRLWLTVSLVATLGLLLGINSRISGTRERGVFATDPPSPYFHYPAKGTELHKVLVVHGLDANKELMNLLCFALSDTGFNVYSMDLPGHGDSRIPFGALDARKAVAAALDSLGPGTIAVGHSMGATMLLDIANDRPLQTMVLLSPAPTPFDQIRADRVLVLTGQFDFPRIVSALPRIQTDSGIREYTQKTIAWSGHSGYLVRPEAIRTMVAWLGGDPKVARTGTRITILVLQLMILVAIPLLWLSGEPSASPAAPGNPILLSYIVACAAALFVSSVVVVLHWLRLFATDYLISFVFLAGVTLLPASLRKSSLVLSRFSVSALAVLYVIAAGFIGSELVHLTLSDGRWWRFLAMAAVLVPLSFADEVLLRPVRPWWKAAGVAVLTRILIAAFVVTGALSTNQNDAFVVLVVHFVVAFWIALWLAGEWVWRRSKNPLAVACFSAVVQAWVFAAIFVTT